MAALRNHFFRKSCWRFPSLSIAAFYLCGYLLEASAGGELSRGNLRRQADAGSAKPWAAAISPFCRRKPSTTSAYWRAAAAVIQDLGSCNVEASSCIICSLFGSFPRSFILAPFVTLVLPVCPCVFSSIAVSGSSLPCARRPLPTQPHPPPPALPSTRRARVALSVRLPGSVSGSLLLAACSMLRLLAHSHNGTSADGRAVGSARMEADRDAYKQTGWQPRYSHWEHQPINQRIAAIDNCCCGGPGGPSLGRPS